MPLKVHFSSPFDDISSKGHHTLESTEGWRTVHREEFHSLFFSLNNSAFNFALSKVACHLRRWQLPKTFGWVLLYFSKNQSTIRLLSSKGCMYMFHFTHYGQSLLQLFLSPGKLCSCISPKCNSTLVPSVKCLLLNVLIEWLCSGKLEVCCMQLNSFSFYAVKKYRNKVPWQSALAIAFVPYR